MTTSLMNTLLSKYMLMWAVKDLPIKIRMITEGDDTMAGFSFDTTSDLKNLSYQE